MRSKKILSRGLCITRLPLLVQIHARHRVLRLDCLIVILTGSLLIIDRVDSCELLLLSGLGPVSII